jgi:hypothetical protein
MLHQHPQLPGMHLDPEGCGATGRVAALVLPAASDDAPRSAGDVARNELDAAGAILGAADGVPAVALVAVAGGGSPAVGRKTDTGAACRTSSAAEAATSARSGFATRATGAAGAATRDAAR